MSSPLMHAALQTDVDLFSNCNYKDKAKKENRNKSAFFSKPHTDKINSISVLDKSEIIIFIDKVTKLKDRHRWLRGYLGTLEYHCDWRSNCNILYII